MEAGGEGEGGGCCEVLGGGGGHGDGKGMGGEGRYGKCWLLLLMMVMMVMVMFWDGTGRFIGIGYAIYGNLDVARGTKISIG